MRRNSSSLQGRSLQGSDDKNRGTRAGPNSHVLSCRSCRVVEHMVMHAGFGRAFTAAIYPLCTKDTEHEPAGHLSRLPACVMLSSTLNRLGPLSRHLKSSSLVGRSNFSKMYQTVERGTPNSQDYRLFFRKFFLRHS